MNFYTSDLHFGLENVISRDNRPFQNVDEMNDCLLKKINEKVSKRDTLYILGDVSCYQVDPVPFLRRISCKNKILISGNHDKRWLKDKGFRDCFVKIFDNTIIYDEKIDKKIFLSHYPMSDWDGYFKGIYLFYGHAHNPDIGGEPYMNTLQNAFNVGVDHNHFTPMTAEEIIKNKKEKNGWV